MKKYLAILFDQTVCGDSGCVASMIVDTLDKNNILQAFYNRGDFDTFDRVEVLIIQSSENSSFTAPQIIKHWSELNGDFDELTFGHLGEEDCFNEDY